MKENDKSLAAFEAVVCWMCRIPITVVLAKRWAIYGKDFGIIAGWLAGIAIMFVLHEVIHWLIFGEEVN